MADDPRTVSDLIADYAELCAEKDEARRAEGLAGLLVELLGFEGMPARRLGEVDHPVLAFRLDGRHHFLETRWPPTPLALPTALPRTGDVQRILLSMSGFTTAGNPLERILLLDKTHFEAALCRVIPLKVLLERMVDGLVVDGRASSSLFELLATSPTPAAPGLAWAHRQQEAPPSPRIMAPGVEMRAALIGNGAWNEPSVCFDPAGRILVTGNAGVFEVDRKRPRTTWTVEIPGCDGAPLTDGPSTLIKHGEGIIRVQGRLVTPVCHVGDGRATLIRGRNGEIWAFTTAERAAHTFHLVTSALADGPPPFHIEFDADVRSCTWLGERRFFLAANGYSGVVDLTVTTRLAKESWRETPGHNPAHAVVLPSGDLLMAVSDPTQRDVQLVRCDPELRSFEVLVELDAFTIHGIGAGPEFISVLADVRSDPSVSIRPVFFELRLPTPDRLRSRAPEPSRRETVALVSTGRKEDYRLEPRPIDTGGQAEVFEAVHKASGTKVAFKKMSGDLPSTTRRARREIEAARLFGDHPNIMPVLDSSRTYNWFVMPYAEHTAETSHPEFAEPARLRELVTAVCEGLRIPHREGWVHRDLKPANILRLNGRWVVADWGLVRRPRGRTSFLQPHGGDGFGTHGWSAPEQLSDPHTVGPQADIYSIGQIIGWALTGRAPQPNKPLLPPDGPWRKIAQVATQENPAARPASVDELLALIDRMLPGSTPAHGSRPQPVAASTSASTSAQTPPSPRYVPRLPNPAWSPPPPSPPSQSVHPALAWPGRILLWMGAVAFGVMTIASIGVTFDQGWGSFGRTVAAIATFAVPFIIILGVTYLDLRRLQARHRARHPAPATTPSEKMPP